MTDQSLTAIGTIFTACAVIFTAFVTLRGQRAIKRQAVDQHVDVVAAVEEVKQEVVTGNAVTLGGLGDAGETRRIEGIPHDQRTRHEQEHLDEAPPDERSQGPPPGR